MPYVRSGRKFNSPMAQRQAESDNEKTSPMAANWQDVSSSLDGADAGGPSSAPPPPPPAPSEAGPSQPAEPRRHAYDPNGPVEAVGLQENNQFWETFRDVRTLGRGHFAKVKQVMHVETKEHFAVKILDKKLADHNLEDLVREFNMLRSLHHANIIRLYGAYETPRKLFLVTELAAGGELMKRLGDLSKVYSEDIVRVYVRTLLDAVGYMHERNCVHRDLKPENVLLSDMSDSAIIKIVDLGLSRFVDGRKLMRTVCGTHKYLAPEMVQTDNGQLQGYDKAIDMWGVGLLTFIMLCGFNPFARESHQDTHTAIVQAQWAFPDGYTVSDAARSFVRSVLQGKAEHRLTAGQATQHPWLSSPPASPSQLLTREREPVQDKLSEFNAHRMLDKVVKSAHRRLTGAASSNTTDTM